MAAANCSRCGRLFNKISGSVCPACDKKNEEIFQKLREYIHENPTCNISELSESTGVTVKRILQYIREGRIEMSKGMHGEVTCSKCGLPISIGNYCEKCMLDIAQDLHGGDDGKKKQQRMHVGSKFRG